MKITVEFDSLEEFKKHMGLIGGISEPAPTFPELAVHPAVMEPGTVVLKGDLIADKISTKTETVTAAEAALTEELNKGQEPEFPAAADKGLTSVNEKGQTVYTKTGDVVDETFRVKIRAMFVEVNRKAGFNLAKQLVSDTTGCSSFAEVPLDKLPEMMAVVQECLESGVSNAK